MRTDPVCMSQPVINAINGELEYIASLNSRGRADTNDHGVAGQLITLDAYTRKAEEAWVNSADEEEALDVLRKVAAIAILALERYGCPERVV